MGTTEAKAWVMVNKGKAVFGFIAGLVALVIMPVTFVTWAEGQTADQIRDAELIQQGRTEVIHSSQAHSMAKQSAKHDYDFYDIRAQVAEQELVYLEQDLDEGVTLTASQGRKMRRLEDQVTDFNEKKDYALKQLSAVETEHETE